MLHLAAAAKSALATTVSVKKRAAPVTPAATASVQHHAVRPANAAQRVIVVPSSF
ncbi:MAG: hypothetical protein NT138_12070 [Planctomycetales bacterium]|nr:hypothetical protein [Planctomycetales bacterium]